MPRGLSEGRNTFVDGLFVSALQFLVVFGHLQVGLEFDGPVDVVVRFEVLEEGNHAVEVGGVGFACGFFEVDEVFEVLCLHI